MSAFEPICKLKHIVGIRHNHGGIGGKSKEATVVKSIDKSFSNFTARTPNVGTVLGFL
jgi:hypothetical protein